VDFGNDVRNGVRALGAFDGLIDKGRAGDAGAAFSAVRFMKTPLRRVASEDATPSALSPVKRLPHQVVHVLRGSCFGSLGDEPCACGAAAGDANSRQQAVGPGGDVAGAVGMDSSKFKFDLASAPPHRAYNDLDVVPQLRHQLQQLGFADTTELAAGDA
jgi:hypothetical protein